jgi:hypothetical protein
MALARPLLLARIMTNQDIHPAFTTLSAADLSKVEGGYCNNPMNPACYWPSGNGSGGSGDFNGPLSGDVNQQFPICLPGSTCVFNEKPGSSKKKKSK